MVLSELGFELDRSSIEARLAQGKSVGRPHLAQAVVSHPANAERLAAEDRTDPSAFAGDDAAKIRAMELTPTHTEDLCRNQESTR